MRGNQFYIVFGVVTAVLLGGAGFYCFKGHGAYTNAGSEFDTRRAALLSLKKSKPYPNEENLKRIEKAVGAYEGEIKGLFKILDRFQQPLSTTASDTEFPQVLKSKIEAFKALAKKKGVKITGDKEFYMAMDAYRTTLPRPKAVPLLDYQLGAIEYLLTQLADAGATELIALKRELLPVEAAESGEGEGKEGGVPADGSSVVAKYPVSLSFETKHPALVKFVNQITNDDKYFFILRALRVDNSSKEGSLKGEGENSGPRYVNAAGDAAPQDLINSIPPGLDVPGQVAWMRENGGYELKSSDARILLGDESLRVFMVVDVVRFADAAEKIAAAGKAGAKGGAGGAAKGKGKKK